MGRLTLVSSILFLLFCVAAASTFEDSNPIQMVSDGLESSVLRVLGHTPHAISFARFAYEHDKQYADVEEMKLRFQIFKDNLDLIRSTNKKGLSYTVAVNRFADLTWEEFKKQRLGGAAQDCYATTKGNHQLTDEVLPESKDWRESGIVTPVKDQGKCGSCWAFSATGAIEAAYHQAYGKVISLSEQQIVDCSGAFDNFGCNGGWPAHAFEYIKYNGGLETEQAYPYTAKDGQCKFSSENVAVRVINSVNITYGAEDELKHAVAMVRPVTVAFEATRPFHFYKSGVFTSDTCGSTPYHVNHAVLAVGYGVENGVPYWLIKNSWGSEWGDHGYFKMEMGKNMCGVASFASYAVVA